jgi:hyperosmotically inducible periplasmic protein
MKTIFCIFFSFLVISLNSGCTIYKAAVDERNVGTIADDTTIKAKIFKRFVDDDVVKALDITTTSYKGHVHLIGEYDDSAQKVRAIELANGVEGVKDVTPYLLAKQENGECGTTRNLELTTKVNAKLVGDKKIWSTNVNVKTIQCIVVLWGTVGIQDEIMRSINHAKSVEGVKTVRSFLKSVR